MVYLIVNTFEYRIQIVVPNSSIHSRSKSHTVILHLFMFVHIYICIVYIQVSN